MTKRLLKLALALPLLSPFFLISAWYLFSQFMAVHMLNVCEKNLRKTHGAVVAYHRDHGTYPRTLLDALRKDEQNIACAQTDTDSYSPGYVVSPDGKDFSICCKGPAHHDLAAADLPRIDTAGKIDLGSDVPLAYRLFLKN